MTILASMLTDAFSGATIMPMDFVGVLSLLQNTRLAIGAAFIELEHAGPIAGSGIVQRASLPDALQEIEHAHIPRTEPEVL